VYGLGSFPGFVWYGEERDITHSCRLFCYLVDHELATQTGKPFAVRDDAIIRGFDQIAVTRYEDVYLTLNVVHCFPSNVFEIVCLRKPTFVIFVSYSDWLVFLCIFWYARLQASDCGICSRRATFKGSAAVRYRGSASGLKRHVRPYDGRSIRRC
jgi:hypothetical protein